MRPPPSSRRPPAPTPLIRGKALQSDRRKLGAQLCLTWLRQAVPAAGLSHRDLAEALGLDKSWADEVLGGHKLPILGDAFVLPTALRRALGLALLLSAENDNSVIRDT